MTTTQTHSPRQTTPARRTALTLLAALALTLGTMAAPLAATAHAGSQSSGVEWRR